MLASGSVKETIEGQARSVSWDFLGELKQERLDGGQERTINNTRLGIYEENDIAV